MTLDIGNRFEELNDRELAVKMDVSEDKIKEMRMENGFLRLDEFQENEEPSDFLKLDFDLDEMEKRKLQGFLGEKVASLMKNKVVLRLEDFVKDSWVLRDKLYLVSSDSSFQRYWASGRPRQGSISIEGRNLKHEGKDREDLKEHVKERCVVASEDIFRKFREVRNPFIDFNFYAVRKTGEKKVEFQVRDYSKKSFDKTEKLEVTVPVIEDFKIVMLEVKTTKEDAKKLFSENQRNARDLAKKSPFLDFFSLKVNKEFEEMDIPENFEVKLEKHS